MPDPAPARTVVLLAGPSGSGKTRLARLSGLPVLRLDDFYFDHDRPGLPLLPGPGHVVDWDDARTWDADAACRAIGELLAYGRTTTPEYSISESRSVGTRDVEIGGANGVIGEGIFALEAAQACAERDMPVQRWWLDRRPGANFARRLGRDLRQHRKSVPVLVRRGVVLWRHEARLRRRALAAGFQPVSADEAARRLSALRAGQSVSAT